MVLNGKTKFKLVDDSVKTSDTTKTNKVKILFKQKKKRCCCKEKTKIF